jgi:hypothetical protein
MKLVEVFMKLFEVFIKFYEVFEACIIDATYDVVCSCLKWFIKCREAV